jgi:hypothetical protein
METVIGHKSTLLFLLAVSYCSWRVSKYGKGKANIISYRVISISSLLVIALYFYRESIPGIGAISIVILFLVMFVLHGVLPIPSLNVDIPNETKKPLFIEIGFILVSVLIIMGVWQRVAP